MGESTSIVALYVPVLVFAHLFAAFWLAKVFLLSNGTGSMFKKKKSAPATGGSPNTPLDADGSAVVKGEGAVVGLSPGHGVKAQIAASAGVNGVDADEHVVKHGEGLVPGDTEVSARLAKGGGWPLSRREREAQGETAMATRRERARLAPRTRAGWVHTDPRDRAESAAGRILERLGARAGPRETQREKRGSWLAAADERRRRATPPSISSSSRTHPRPPLRSKKQNTTTTNQKQTTAEDLDAAESASRPPSSLASSSQDLSAAAAKGGAGGGAGAMAGAGGAAAAAMARQHLGEAVERVTVEWQRLGCTYRVPGGSKVVLQDVWGIARPGEMQVRFGFPRGGAGGGGGRGDPEGASEGGA